MSRTWQIEPCFREHPLAELMDSYEAAENLALSRSGFKPYADRQTFPIDVNGERFFVKHYRHRTAWWRAVGRSRPRRERNNMALFDALGVPTTPLAAFGEERIFGIYDQGGILVTKGLDNCIDMHRLGEHQPQLFRDKVWFDRLSRRLAGLLRRMHGSGFCHNDLNWRNVLVRAEPEFEVFILDCHGDHFVRPGNTDVNTNQFQLRKIAGHGIKRNGLADATAGKLRGIDQRLTHLHLNRYL